MDATFKRARNEEQRAERRRAILDVASAMLAEMPVAQISLNELARRVGLAKSNVLRYFESREAVLIKLLNRELDAWVDQLAESHLTATGPAGARCEAVASWLGTSIAARPVLCDLISSQASVLERNVSTDLVVEHKRATAQTVARLETLVRDDLPELSSEDAYTVISYALLMTSAVWPQAEPSDAVKAAYESHPELAEQHQTCEQWLSTSLSLLISGLLVRRTR